MKALETNHSDICDSKHSVLIMQMLPQYDVRSNNEVHKCSPPQTHPFLSLQCELGILPHQQACTCAEGGMPVCQAVVFCGENPLLVYFGSRECALTQHRAELGFRCLGSFGTSAQSPRGWEPVRAYVFVCVCVRSDSSGLSQSSQFPHLQRGRLEKATWREDAQSFRCRRRAITRLRMCSQNGGG